MIEFTVEKKMRPSGAIEVAIFAEGREIGRRISKRAFRFALILKVEERLFVASWHQSRHSLPKEALPGFFAVVEID